MKNKTGGKLLVVDNDQEYRKALCDYLRIEDFDVDSTASVEDAIKYLDTISYDLILLDVRLRDNNEPQDISGGEVAKKAREIGIPCIMITAYPSTDVSRIFLNSLSANPLAHDVLVKKEPLTILTAIKTVLGRKGKHRPLEEPVLVINEELGLVTLRGKPIRLPQKQYDLLLCLAKKEGAVIGHREIIKAVYGETLTEGESREDPRLERLVVRVRQKIEDNPAAPRFLCTEKGRGYRLLITGKEIPLESPG